jgi:hypothetical protein
MLSVVSTAGRLTRAYLPEPRARWKSIRACSIHARIMQAALSAMIGVVGGALGGLVGLGGGFIMVPLLTYLLGMSQHEAQGTSLAVLLPPVGVLAVLQYYRAGNVNVRVALCAAVGFLLGGYLGGMVAQLIPDRPLRRIFATLLIVIALDLFRR